MSEVPVETQKTLIYQGFHREYIIQLTIYVLGLANAY